MLHAMARMIAFYNDVVDEKITSNINDSTKIGWSWVLRRRLEKGQRGSFSEAKAIIALYRPFEKRWLYYDGFFNENRYRMTRLFPEGREDNRVIVVKQRWSGHGQLALMADRVVDVQSDGGTQCFPLYLYDGREDADEGDKSQSQLFAAAKRAPTGLARRDGITDAGLAHFEAAYPGETITKEDIFYYVYGILHSADYRERYADNLGKELPRIPRVKKAGDFWAFSRAGRTLGELHVGFEQVSEYPARIEGPAKPTGASYRVEKMKFGKGKDKSVIHYNDVITVRDIPLDAYEYVVNGKSAIEWVMERQGVTTDKASGIVKDANAWANETVRDPRYPLSLLLRVITVSLETMKIVNSLPSLEILDESATSIEPSASVA
jgi:predicted helicase